MEKLLTVNDLCEWLQVSKSLVYKWVHYGFIPYIKIGEVVRFKEAQIERWIRTREKKGRVACKMKIEEMM